MPEFQTEILLIKLKKMWKNLWIFFVYDVFDEQQTNASGYMHVLIIVALCVCYSDFFSAKKMSPCYMVHKKIADQPCYNVIFYLRRIEHKY